LAYPDDLDDANSIVVGNADDPEDNPSKITFFQKVRSAIIALETKVGITGSTVATSLDRQMEVHAHTVGADDGGQVAHADLGSVGTGDHHPQGHGVADHTTAITVQDEGTTQGDVTTVNFTGSGVTASVNTGVATVSIPGGGGSASGPFGPFAQLVYRDGSTFYRKDLFGNIVSSGSAAATVINDAILDVSILGGGTVFLAAATYPINATINVLAGVELAGEGTYGRQVNSGTAFGFGTLLTKNTSAFGFTMVSLGVNAYGARVRQLTVDGTHATRANIGVAVLAGGEKVIDVLAQDCVTGFNVSTSGSAVTHAPEIHNWMAQNCGVGLNVSNGTDGYITNGRALQCTGSASVNISAGGWQMSGCHLTTGATSAPIALNLDGGNCMIVNNYFDTHRAGTTLLNVTSGGNRSTIVGNFFIDGTATFGQHILLPSNPRVTITGNAFEAQNSARAFCKFGGTVQNATIVGNMGQRGASSQAWIAPVIDSSNVAVPNTDTANCYVEGNKAFTS
jgi:hypothetical protein